MGDVCISLKPREFKILSPHKKSNHQQPQHHFHHHQQQQLQQLHREQQTIKDEMYPQNLSRRSQTIPTTTTGTAVTSRQIPPMEHHAGGPFSPSIYLHHALFAAAQGRMPNLPASYAPYNLSDKQMSRCNDDSPRVQQHEHEITSVALNTTTTTTTTLNTDQLPLSMVLPKTPSTSTSSGISSESDDYNDPSRKRRWSAPDVEDDHQSALHPPPPRKLIN